MKNNLILSLIFIFSLVLHSEESLAQSEPFFGTMSQNIQIENIPNITIRIGKDKPIACKLDVVAKIYICKNNGKPILVKQTSADFSAIAKDSKNSVVTPDITHVEANGKTIYDGPVVGFAKPPQGESSGSLNTHNFRVIDDFFSYYDSKGVRKESSNGSQDYLSIYKSFIEEKKRIEKTFNEPNYLVELENGKKIKCARGSKRPYSTYGKSDEKYLWDKFQCGSFKCDSIKVEGKDYNVTMFYDSEEGSLDENSLHLIDKNGFGPSVKIKKIFSSDSKKTVIDNSAKLNSPDNKIPVPFISKLDENKITTYKNPNFQDILDHNIEVCTDDDNSLIGLQDEKNKFLKKISELELVEFIQILGDGTLTSDFVDPTQALQLGCFYQGVYFNQKAAKNLNKLKKNLYPENNTKKTISMSRATELFNKAVKMEDIPWEYTQEGCFARAHLMARRFEAEGVQVDKVWLKGALYLADSDPVVEWSFHVAPIVYVKDEKGKVQKMVIDPSIFSKPVTVEEWDRKISKRTLKGTVITAFPYPDNTSLMERASLSFSSSDPFMVNDNIDMTEKEKRERANGAMRYFKTL